MKDIKAIVNEHAADVADDVKEAIIADVKANYKTAAEWAKKVERIGELESQVATLSEQASRIESDAAEVEQLKSQLESYREADERRKADEEEAARRDEFRKSFDEALNGRKFANGIVEKSVFEQAYEACTGTAGKGAKEALEEIVGDADGVWVNPQRDPQWMPTKEILEKKAASDEAKKKSFAEALFGPPTRKD